jgi:hypothetical protein
MDQQANAQLSRLPIPELDHFMELVGRIDVQERKRDRSGIKRLLCQPKHYRRILAN